MLAGFSHYDILAVTADFGDFQLMKAADRNTGVHYTVKSISVSTLRDSKSYKSFRFSLSIFRELHHDNIAEVVDVVEEDDRIYVVLEPCETNLLSFLLHGEMKPMLLECMFREIVDAVQYCHSRGLSCPNLRPDNILLTDTLSIKLANIGESGKSRVSFMFKAPELISGACSYEWWETDMWTLGVLFYAMSVGELPWKSGSRQEVEEQIMSGKFEFPATMHPHLAGIIVRLMNVDPKERWTIDDLLQCKWVHTRRSSLDELSSVLKDIYDNPKKTFRPKLVGRRKFRTAGLR